MSRSMRVFQMIMFGSLCVFLVLGIRPSSAANAVVGDGSAASCTQTAFNNALATAQSGGGTITFDCDLATIPFTAQKVISSNVVIDGGGMITLSGGDVTRLFYVQNGRSLILRNIILSDGYSGSDYGGAVYVENGGLLTLDGSTIQDSATNDWAGGAIIDFGGTVTIKDSTIANNQSSYGAINSVGTLEITRSTIMSNTATLGGGGLSVGGDVTITDSHLHHNTAPVGGAMLVTNAADVTIQKSTFNENTANGTILEETGGGAIMSGGYLHIERTTFEGNVSEGSGGAIQIGYQGTSADVFITQSAFIGNQAVVYGGGIYNQDGLLQLVNSTLSANVAQESGGGLTSFLGPTTLIYVTAVNNGGGNLNQLADLNFDSIRQRINLSFTAVAGGADNCQITGNPSPDPIPYFYSLDNNLSSDDTCEVYLGEPNDLNLAPAMLDALADNGGVTLTHLPQAGSPLIDTAVCQPDHFIDQRGIIRPQNGLCDIGAVEIASNTTGPTPTPLPTSTAVPSPTPMPTPTVPSPNDPPPAFNPIRINGGVRPTISLSVNHAYGGQDVTVSGSGVNGYNKVRIFSVEKGQTVGAVETAVVNNLYQTKLRIPYTMPEGQTQLCAAVVGAANGELACTPFTVDPMPNGFATGQIQGGNFGSWNAQANLIDTRGRLVQTTPVDTSGAFQFTDIPPGVYQYAISGQTGGGGVSGGGLTVYPANNELINAPLSPAVECALRPRSSYLLLDHKNNKPAATDIAVDGYTAVLQPKLNPLVSAVDDIQLDWGKFQREKFGYYVAGVHHAVDFVAIPQVDGTITKVEFNLRRVDGSLIKIGEPQYDPPYTVAFNMGDMPLSDYRGDPYIEVIPYVNGQKRCPATFPVQVIPDPMIDPAFRGDSRTWWDKPANVYRFEGVIPNIPQLPFKFDIPSSGEIPNFGVLKNRVDMGIYVRGILTEERILKMETAQTRAELTLLNATIIDPNDFESITVPDKTQAYQQLQEFKIEIPSGGGTLEVLPHKEFGLPFTAVPVFNLLGIDFVVGSSAKVGFTVYLNGYVQPFKPKASATLTPDGYGEGVLAFGTGLGGVLNAGSGFGFRAGLKLPITAEVPQLSLDISACPQIETFWVVFARLGLWSDDYQVPIYGYSPGCYPLLRSGADPEIPLPSLLAAPSVAASSDGQVVSAYVQNTAVSGTPTPQIMVRFQDSGTGLWQMATAVSNPEHSVGTPVVAFAGADNLPIVVWTENSFDSGNSTKLSDNFNAIVNRQDLYYSWYENGSWQPPVRLTNDLFAGGMPTLAGSSSGALLTWVRDTDGNPLTRTDQRIAVAEFNATTHQFGAITLLTGGATGLNAEPRAAYDNTTPYLVWTYDSDADLRTATDRHLAIAHETGGAWVVETPPNIPAAVDSPAIVGGQNGVTIAFLVREPDAEEDVVNHYDTGMLGMNGQVWTARQGTGAWHATPLRDDAGAFVYAERPYLAGNQNETLLAFRRFGDVATNAKLGQLSLSTAQGTDDFSSPLYVTDESQQFWQLALAVNPVTEQAVLVYVERPSNTLARGTEVQRIAAMESVMQTKSATLALADDPVAAVTMAPTADPALEKLYPSDTAVAAGEPLTVTAVLRNVGRNAAENMTVKLYSGAPGSGSLIRTQVVSGPLLFNQKMNVDFAVTAVAGKQNIYAEVTTNGENSTTANDRAFTTLGDLTTPAMHDVIVSGFTPDALDVSWYPPLDEYVNSYRILRSTSASGPFEFIGESVFASFTDTLVTDGETYCYKVQSYNGAFHVSAQSDVLCGRAGGNFEIYLPLVIK